MGREELRELVVQGELEEMAVEGLMPEEIGEECPVYVAKADRMCISDLGEVLSFMSVFVCFCFSNMF